jgi:hypothetical protein
LAELPFHFFKAVQKKLFVFRERSTKHAEDLRTGLPDFHTKHTKTGGKYTKLP